MSASTGMIYDRALTPELLDVGLRIASKVGQSPDARRVLTMALRDHVSEQEATGKTKKCLTRVWIRPPPQARPLIAWGVEHQHLDPGHTVLHLGAILATFPFAAAVVALAGRQLQMEDHVEPEVVRAGIRRRFGDRPSVDIGTRKVLTTLRYLGLLERSEEGPRHRHLQPIVPPELTGWITHALLLGRDVSAVGAEEVTRAPELAFVALRDRFPIDYPLLELHTEANRTVVTCVPSPNVASEAR